MWLLTIWEASEKTEISVDNLEIKLIIVFSSMSGFVEESGAKSLSRMKPANSDTEKVDLRNAFACCTLKGLD